MKFKNLFRHLANTLSLFSLGLVFSSTPLFAAGEKSLLADFDTSISAADPKLAAQKAMREHPKQPTEKELESFALALASAAVKYNVTFPMFEKIDVNGPNRHPLYTALAGKTSPFPGDIKWNFGKFLIGKDGKILKRFEPKTQPDSPEVIAAIEAALATH